MNTYQFFLKHAGFSYDPKTETRMQGRMKCARMLAKAEREARDGGFSYQWSIDPDILSSDWIHDNEDGERDHDPWHTWQCAMYAPYKPQEEYYGLRPGIVASLHGIDFGRDGKPWGNPYKRVVEAELAIDGLTNEPQ